MSKPKLIAVYATDWIHYHDQCKQDEPCPLIHAWVVGYLKRETKDHIEIAQQLFEDNL